LQIDAGLVDHLVEGDILALAVTVEAELLRVKTRFATGAGKVGETNIPYAVSGGPAQGNIGAFVARAGSVVGIVVIHLQADAGAPIAAREGAFAKTRQQEQFDIAKSRNPGEMNHWLAQQFFSVGALHQVDLVDDIHQMHRLRNAPEHLVGAQFPVLFHPVPVELADIAVAAFAVAFIPAHKGGKGDAVAVGEGVIKLRLEGQ